MRIHFLVIFLMVSFIGNAQEERDTALSRCPVFITDTITSNNFFIEAKPCILKVYRSKGNLTVVVEQKDQYFTLLFTDRKLKNSKYKIGRDLRAKYSFRSGDQVSYVDVANGTVDVMYDEELKVWKLKVNGLIANLVERTITYYKVRADLKLKG